MSRKIVLLASTLLLGAVSTVPSLAHAQAAPADQPKADDSKVSEVKEVVVTGTRFKRTEYNSVSPVQVLSADTARLEGATTTHDLLMTSTLIQGSFQVNNELTGFVNTGGPGVNSASLRGLGANRTLILVDGERVGPAGVRGTVGPIDLNTIPFSIVDQVQILKDGASPIYGSDAVAGVINVITKKNLDGGVMNVSTKQTQLGGGAQYHLDAAWGKIFPRGYFNAAVEYNEQDVLTRGDRKDTRCAADYEFAPDYSARIDFNGLDGSTKCYNLFANAINTGSYGTAIYAQPGVTYPTAQQGNSGGTNNAAGAYGSKPMPFGLVRELRAGFPGTYPYALEEFPAITDRASVVSPDKIFSAKFRAGYNFSSDLQWFGDLLVNRRLSSQQSFRQFFPSFSTANPNNPFGTTLGSLLPIVPLTSNSNQEVDYLNFRTGFRGAIAGGVPVIGGWKWDAYFGESRSYGRYGNDIIYNDRVLAVTGSQACNQALITISGGSCATVPNGIPLLNPAELSGQFTPAEAAFLFTHENSKTLYEQQDFEVTTQGKLFHLPGGDLGVVVGVDARHVHIDDQPGVNQRNANLWGQSAAGRTKGSDTVKEIFTEIDAPLLKDQLLIKSFDLQMAGRYTNYDSYGGSSTYKIGAVWAINNWLTLRADHGTSFRAPALYELYLANQTSFANQVGLDPCINWDQSANATLQKNCQARGVPAGYNAAGTASATITTGGGKGILKAETSQATVIGLIFQPTIAPVKVAVDYTNLEIDNEVSQPGSANIANLCFTSQNYPNDPYCKLLTTGSFAPGGPNQILTVNNSYVNLATQKLHALDVTLDAWHNIGANHFSMRLTASWDLRTTTQLFKTSAPSDYTNTTYNYNGPQFNGNANFQWKNGPWLGLWSVNMIGHGSDQRFLGSSGSSTRYSSTCKVGATVGPCTTLLGTGPLSVVPATVGLKNIVEAKITNSVSIQRTIGTWTGTFAVRNIFDVQPPQVSAGEFRSGTAALNAYEDEYLGRQFFISIGKKF